MKAIIPAAGLGTRFLPATKVVPKEMICILDKPVIQYVVEEALQAPQCSSCVIVSNSDKEMIKKHFTRNKKLEDTLTQRNKHIYAQEVEKAGNLPVTFCYQHEALGLGHAVYSASSALDKEPFYVLLGDVIVPQACILDKLKEIYDTYHAQNVIAVMRVPHKEVSRFGVIAGDCIKLGDHDDPYGKNAVYKVTDLVEKPALDDAPTDLIIFGRYLLSPHIMELLAQTPAGAGGEIQLTDALRASLNDEPMYAVVIDGSDGFDTGTVENMVYTQVKMALLDERYKDDMRLMLKNL